MTTTPRRIRPTALPIPAAGRDSIFVPDYAGEGPTAVYHLTGPHAIFRFSINLLFHQIDIASSARPVLVDLREHMGAGRFDAMARSMMGDEQFARHRYQFERSWDCAACEEEIKVGAPYAPTLDGGAACKRCCTGMAEYAEALRTCRRPEPTVITDPKLLNGFIELHGLRCSAVGEDGDDGVVVIGHNDHAATVKALIAYLTGHLGWDAETAVREFDRPGGTGSDYLVRYARFTVAEHGGWNVNWDATSPADGLIPVTFFDCA